MFFIVNGQENIKANNFNLEIKGQETIFYARYGSYYSITKQIFLVSDQNFLPLSILVCHTVGKMPAQKLHNLQISEEVLHIPSLTYRQNSTHTDQQTPFVSTYPSPRTQTMFVKAVGSMSRTCCLWCKQLKVKSIYTSSHSV